MANNTSPNFAASVAEPPTNTSTPSIFSLTGTPPFYAGASKKRLFADSSSSEEGGVPLPANMGNEESVAESPPTPPTPFASLPTLFDEVNLYELNEDKQHAFYKRHFLGTNSPLCDIGTTPSACYDYPELDRAIFKAHIKHKTFTVKIWVNFDTVEGTFFEGARAEDCGQLRIPEAKKEVIIALDPQVCHVIFEIGTPFRDLAHVKLDVFPNKHRPGMRVRASVHPVGDKSTRWRHLENYLQECRDYIVDDIRPGVEGLSLFELERVAALFRCERKWERGTAWQWERPVGGGGRWARSPSPALARRTGGRTLRRKGSLENLPRFPLSEEYVIR